MKFLIDMNLSPGWIDVLAAEGWEAVNRSRVQGATWLSLYASALLVLDGWT